MYFSMSARLYSCGNKDEKLKSCVEPDAVILFSCTTSRVTAIHSSSFQNYPSSSVKLKSTAFCFRGEMF